MFWLKMDGSRMIDNGEHFDVPHKPGDRLWVKEPWRVQAFGSPPAQGRLIYEAGGITDWITDAGQFPSDMFERDLQSTDFWRKGMPRWASRITLEVTAVRCEQEDGKWYWIYDFEVMK